jgi:hypothetical protein
VGLALAVFVRWAQATQRRRVLGAFALPFWTLSGVVGVVLGFIWCCTAHRAGWANANLLLLPPLCLLLVPGAWSLLRGRPVSRVHGWVRIAVVALGAVALLLQLGPQAQFQTPWLVLLLPIHAAFATRRE